MTRVVVVVVVVVVKPARCIRMNLRFWFLNRLMSDVGPPWRFRGLRLDRHAGPNTNRAAVFDVQVDEGNRYWYLRLVKWLNS